ncbi:unnamed protein product [Caenorhabditis bovis]|uniref:EGF-like domain-containing protein n=1 Tax=Caenorhabditis bovis TaxID=2654633 RepID=A0A8S1F0Z5_9PELO|nr:unnamed protein product [Caenorhabditis bovis]
MNTVISLMMPITLPDKDERNKSMKTQVDRHHAYEVGDAVFVKDYRSKQTWSPGVIIRRLGAVNYLVNCQGNQWHRHANQLRRRDHQNQRLLLHMDFDLPMPIRRPSTPTTVPTQPTVALTGNQERAPSTPTTIPVHTRTTQGPPLRRSSRNTREPRRLILDPRQKSYIWHQHFAGEIQGVSLFAWLCIDNLTLCCPEGDFGPQCDKCPGLAENGTACAGRGKCHGNGSRKGSGKCKCDDGYSGNLCRHCDAGYFQVENEQGKIITCKKCYEGCFGVCNSEGPKGCTKCKNGWKLDEIEGCIDIDECQNSDACTKENEVCVYSVGSFRCDCAADHKRDDKNNCVLDIEAPPYRSIVPPDQLLRFISMSSLVFIITFVVWYRYPLLYVLTAIAVVALILVDLYITPQSVPDEAKRFLGY